MLVRTDVTQSTAIYAPSAAVKDKWIKEIKACIAALPPIVVEQKVMTTHAAPLKDKAPSLFKLGKLLKGEIQPIKSGKASKELQAAIQSVESNDASFTKLMLPKAGMKAKGMKHLAAALLNNSVITQMVLPYNNIEDKGANRLAAALHDGLVGKLTTLILDGNGIRESAALVEIVRKAKALTELSLAENNLGDDIKILLETVQAHKALRTLNISANQITDASAPYIADLIKVNHTLTELDLDSNSFTAKGDAIIVKGLNDGIGSALTTVTFKSGVAKAELDALLKRYKERSERLEKLEKSGAKVDLKAQTINEEILDLGYLRADKLAVTPLGDKITSLYLDSCNLQEIPMALVQNIPSLSTLILINNKLSNLPKELFKVNSLKELDLSNNNLSKIQPEIEQLSNLTFLGLGFNALFAIPVELCKLTKLKKLYLHGNNMYPWLLLL
jgi:Ran GTPase-activating protein (RanGAP) involved in mRNA processing and transport